MLGVAVWNNVKLGSVSKYNFYKKMCIVKLTLIQSFLSKEGLKNIFQLKKLVS